MSVEHDQFMLLNYYELYSVESCVKDNMEIMQLFVKWQINKQFNCKSTKHIQNMFYKNMYKTL